MMDDQAAPSSYLHIDQNDFLYRKHKKLKEEDVAVCVCKFKAEDPDSPCGERCLNVLTSTECTPEFCPCGSDCKNQRFQRHTYPTLKLVKTEGRGWGLLADENIKTGQFIIEYCGEVISWKEARRRSQTYEAEGRMDAYIISLNAYESIDATKKGNLARFINHSCQPNCETRKWTVLGETRVGIFSKEDIPAGTELAYNYNFEWYGGAKVRCLCGAPCCSGYLGAKSRGFQEDTYLWEDDDERYSIDDIPLYDSAEDEPVEKPQKVSNSKMGTPMQRALKDSDHFGSAERVNLPFGGDHSKVDPRNKDEAPLEANADPRGIVKIPSQDKHASFNHNESTSRLPMNAYRSYTSFSHMPKSKGKLRGRRLKGLTEEVKAEIVSRLLPSEEARKEVIACEETKKLATSQLNILFDEIRPAIEEHEKDSQDSVPTALAARWIEASCSKLKADFNLYSSIIKHLVPSPPVTYEAADREGNQREVKQ